MTPTPPPSPSTLQALTERIIELVPDIITRLYKDPEMQKMAVQNGLVTIPLSAVLLAIFNGNPDAHVGCYQSGQFWIDMKNAGVDWNLSQDDLSLQSPQTQEWLLGVLSPAQQ